MLRSVGHLESENLQKTTQLFILRYLVQYPIFKLFRSVVHQLSREKESGTDRRTDRQTHESKTYMPPTANLCHSYFVWKCKKVLIMVIQSKHYNLGTGNEKKYEPSTMSYSTNTYRPPSRRHYICNQIYSFLDLLQLFPACVLWKSGSIIIYSQICIFSSAYEL